MQVVSTNVGKVKVINYQGKLVKTGIYKYPVTKGIYLEAVDVKGDAVVDRCLHGGIDKACYLYSYDVYDYWKKLHPDLDWDYGMFGENLTVKGLDEKQIHIGAQYKIGEAIIEVSQPRQPCFKFGIRMGTQTILKQFVNTTYSGFYIRVLQRGFVKSGDLLECVKPEQNAPTIADAFYCLYQPQIKRLMLNELLHCETLADSCKQDIERRLG